ncbi:MAG TPA: DUF1330 domain-containing protein [Steroidobacteraceae bacterium]|jgi:uncharacterized protein (DUF1330 family)|nr:DUF1330 domain-containing protein [Steroidobacteraceae bacterium]
MPAYMVAQYRSSQEYAAYRTAVAELNRKYDARILTQSGTARSVEGEWNHDSMVIIEFASLEVAQQFYQSREYAEVKALRQGAPPISIVVVDGVPGE